MTDPSDTQLTPAPDEPPRYESAGEPFEAPQGRVVYYKVGGPLAAPLGCLTGVMVFAVMLVGVPLLMLAGGLFYVFGGRRLARAMFSRARFPGQRTPTGVSPSDPDVIDVQPHDH